MYLKQLHLEFFRNYLSLNLDFTPGITVLVGQNAKGKTNLLEAIFMLAIGKSFRARRQLEVINWDNRDYARLETYAEIGNETKHLELILDNRSKFHKVAKIDSVEARFLEYIGTLRAVLFVPEDLNLISGSPALRRRYFDVALSQIDRKYLYALLQYDKILHNRNSLLQNIKAGRAQADELKFWNEELAKEAAYIIQQRWLTVQSWNKAISSLYSEVAGGQDFELEVKYKAAVTLEDLKEESIARVLQQELEEQSAREIELGYTLVGPHREDYSFYLGGRNLALYGSRGECRTAVLVLKLQELSHLSQKTGERPIFLLDDVFSELDKTRRKALLARIREGQTIITTTDKGYFKDMEEGLTIKEMQTLTK